MPIIKSGHCLQLHHYVWSTNNLQEAQDSVHYKLTLMRLQQVMIVGWTPMLTLPPVLSEAFNGYCITIIKVIKLFVRYLYFRSQALTFPRAKNPQRELGGDWKCRSVNIGTKQ